MPGNLALLATDHGASMPEYLHESLAVDLQLVTMPYYLGVIMHQGVLPDHPFWRTFFAASGATENAFVVNWPARGMPFAATRRPPRNTPELIGHLLERGQKTAWRAWLPSSPYVPILRVDGAGIDTIYIGPLAHMLLLYCKPNSDNNQET